MSGEQNAGTDVTVREGTEISIGSPSETAMQIAIKEVFGTLGGPAIHNFQGNAVDTWKMQALCTGPDCLGFEDVPADGIAVVNFYVHKVEYERQDDGEVMDIVRCVLVTDDGQAYGFMSNTLARDLARMVSVFGMKKWTPAVRVKIVENKGRAGHKFYSIAPL